MVNKNFVIWLSFISILPLTLMLLASTIHVAAAVTILAFLFGVLGTAHVPATLYLFSYKSIRERKSLFMFMVLYILISIPVLMLILLYCNKLMLLLLVCGYLMWQNWHYGMQNVGLCAISSSVGEEKKCGVLQKQLLVLAAVCGVLGSIKSASSYSLGYSGYLNIDNYQYIINTLFIIGGVGYLCCFMVALYHYHYFNFARTRVLYLCLISFYFPLFIYTENPILSFGVYASTHGLQYLSILSMSSIEAIGFKEKVFSVLFLLLACFLGYDIYTGFGQAAGYIMNITHTRGIVSTQLGNISADTIIGISIMYLVTTAHFIFDSQIWSGRFAKNRPFLKEFFRTG